MLQSRRQEQVFDKPCFVKVETDDMAAVDTIATKLAAVDATLPFLATKSDISDVRTEIAEVRTEISAVRTENAKGQTSMIRWFVGTTITIVAVAVTLFGVIIGLIVTRLP